MALVGAGSMGGALLRGWLSSGTIDPEKSSVVDPGADKSLKKLARDKGFALNPDPAEIHADVIMKATQVDGVYNADPARDPKAIRYDELDYAEALRRDLRFMDQTAIALCRENDLPIMVFDMKDRDFQRADLRLRQDAEAREEASQLGDALDVEHLVRRRDAGRASDPADQHTLQHEDADDDGQQQRDGGGAEEAQQRLHRTGGVRRDHVEGHPFNLPQFPAQGLQALGPDPVVIGQENPHLTQGYLTPDS